MKWRDKYKNGNRYLPGTKIMPTCIVTGEDDDAKWVIGNIYTIRSFYEYNKKFKTNSYILEGIVNPIYEREFKVVK